MHRVGVISALAFLLVSILALAQQQTASMASIEGVVVRADSGEPVSGVQVVLSGGPVPANTAGAAAAGLRGGGGRGEVSTPITATTGADGKFSFNNLAVGSYRLTATANGFVRQEYGQRDIYGQGYPIVLTVGQAVKDAAIRLTATGTVRGRVFDESGQPAANAPIQLIRPVYNSQGRTLSIDGEGSTDDRGEFRVYGVTPGHYYLAAGTPPGPRPATPRFTFVYYPNSSKLEQATLLEVNAGDEMAVDIHVRRQHQTYRVRGRIVDTRGTSLSSAMRPTILFASRSSITSGALAGRILDPADGTFELQDIPPGEYTVIVQVISPSAGQVDGTTFDAQQAARLGGRTPVRVTDTNIDDVVVTLTPAFLTTGRIMVEVQPISAPVAFENMAFGLSAPVPISSVGVLPNVSSIKPDGSFEVGLREGESRVQVIRVPPGFYVKSIDYGGSDILGKVHNFMASDVAKFKVTIRAGAAQINGTVADVNSQLVQGVPVVLIPVDRGRMDLSQTVNADRIGRFAFPNLTPGDYKIFSWEAADTGAAYDPDFTKQYDQVPVVHVAEGSNQTISVRMIPAP